MPVLPADVSSAYRWLLGREPAPEEVKLWLPVESVAELRRLFLDSAEFRAIMARFRGSTAESGARLPLSLPPSRIDWQSDPETETILLQHVTRTWTMLGHDRPHWSVLSADAFLPERIEDNADWFYASGADDAKRILSALARHGLAPDDIKQVVEYGCGVGRVTPYLAEAFKSVTACDISESHLGLAREAVERGGHTNVRFILARAPEFGLTDAFDLWFSYIVLQHNPPPVIAMILRRAFRMLAPGGIAMFQVPTYASDYRFATQDYLANPTDAGTIEVHCLPQSVVFQLAHETGCVPLEVREDDAMGPPSAWLSNTFIVRKPH